MTTYSAAQIVADACMISKVPGYTAQGGRALNYVLDDLSLHRNLKVNLVTETLNLASNSNGPFNLPANYLRTYDLVYYVSGEPFFLNPASLREYDQEVQQLTNSYPYEFATDLSPVANGAVGLLYIYPQSTGPLVATHRYYLQQPIIVAPETSQTIPWFSDQDYLTMATATRLMRISDDDRYNGFVEHCEAMLLKHLLTEGDEQQVVKEVQLDWRRFKLKGALRSTKNFPW